RVVRHVRVEGDRPEILDIRRVVEVDGVPGLVEVEQPAIRADAKRHAGTSFERSLLQQLPLGKIDRPQLMMADVLQQHVAAPAIGAEREAQSPLRRYRAQGEELQVALAEIDSPDDQQPAMKQLVFERE